MPNLLEYSNNYSITSGSLFKYYREKPALDDDGDIVDFVANNTADLFKLKLSVTKRTFVDGNT